MSTARNRGGEALAEALVYVEAGYAVAPVTIRLDERGARWGTSGHCRRSSVLTFTERQNEAREAS